MSDIKKAIIIGAGPAGLSAALRLNQNNGISCHLYEIRPESTRLGGSIGIQPNGLRLLDRLSAFKPYAARAFEASSVTIYSIHGGILGRTDLAAWSREQTGYGYLRGKRTDLIDVLVGLAREQGIQVHFSKSINSIRETDRQITVTFSDGTSDTADILLGCDGIHSKVRTLYVDPEVTPHYTGMSGIYSVVAKSAVPTRIPLDGAKGSFTTRGLFMVMPCTASGDELFWGFSRELPIPPYGDTRDGWEENEKQEVENFKSLLSELVKDVQGDWGTLLRDLINQTNVVNFFPVFKLPLGGKWSKGRCILLGDAGHAMAPHAGQGTSMALEDAFLLSRLLKESSAPLKEIFDKFEEIRRPRIENFYKAAGRNADNRKDTTPLGLRLKEWAIWGGLHLASTFGGFERWITGQNKMLYDIEKASI